MPTCDRERGVRTAGPKPASTYFRAHVAPEWVSCGLGRNRATHAAIYALLLVVAAYTGATAQPVERRLSAIHGPEHVSVVRSRQMPTTVIHRWGPPEATSTQYDGQPAEGASRQHTTPIAKRTAAGGCRDKPTSNKRNGGAERRAPCERALPARCQFEVEGQEGHETPPLDGTPPLGPRTADSKHLTQPHATNSDSDRQAASAAQGHLASMAGKTYAMEVDGQADPLPALKRSKHVLEQKHAGDYDDIVEIEFSPTFEKLMREQLPVLETKDKTSLTAQQSVHIDKQHMAATAILGGYNHYNGNGYLALQTTVPRSQRKVVTVRNPQAIIGLSKPLSRATGSDLLDKYLRKERFTDFTILEGTPNTTSGAVTARMMSADHADLLQAGYSATGEPLETPLNVVRGQGYVVGSEVRDLHSVVLANENWKGKPKFDREHEVLETMLTMPQQQQLMWEYDHCFVPAIDSQFMVMVLTVAANVQKLVQKQVLVDSEEMQVAQIMSMVDAEKQGLRTQREGGSIDYAFTINSIPSYVTDTMVVNYLNSLMVTKLGASAKDYSAAVVKVGASWGDRVVLVCTTDAKYLLGAIQHSKSTNPALALGGTVALITASFRSVLGATNAKDPQHYQHSCLAHEQGKKYHEVAPAAYAKVNQSGTRQMMHMHQLRGHAQRTDIREGCTSHTPSRPSTPHAQMHRSALAGNRAAGRKHMAPQRRSSEQQQVRPHQECSSGSHRPATHGKWMCHVSNADLPSQPKHREDWMTAQAEGPGATSDKKAAAEDAGSAGKLRTSDKATVRSQRPSHNSTRQHRQSISGRQGDMACTAGSSTCHQNGTTCIAHCLRAGTGGYPQPGGATHDQARPKDTRPAWPWCSGVGMAMVTMAAATAAMHGLVAWLWRAVACAHQPSSQIQQTVQAVLTVRTMNGLFRHLPHYRKLALCRKAASNTVGGKHVRRHLGLCRGAWMQQHAPACKTWLQQVRQACQDHPRILELLQNPQHTTILGPIQGCLLVWIKEACMPTAANQPYKPERTRAQRTRATASNMSPPIVRPTHGIYRAGREASKSRKAPDSPGEVNRQVEGDGDGQHTQENIAFKKNGLGRPMTRICKRYAYMYSQKLVQRQRAETTTPPYLQLRVQLCVTPQNTVQLTIAPLPERGRREPAQTVGGTRHKPRRPPVHQQVGSSTLPTENRGGSSVGEQKREDQVNTARRSGVSATPRTQQGGLAQAKAPCTAARRPEGIPADMYYEPQQGRLCWIHALNMALGHQSFSGSKVYTKLSQELTAWQARAEAGHEVEADTCRALRTTMEERSESGPFETTSICRYMYRHIRERITLAQVRMAGGTARAWTQQEILAAAPHGTDCLLVACEMRSCRADHVKCIKLHRGTQVWYELDSEPGESSGPLRTDAQWRRATHNTTIYCLMQYDAAHPPYAMMGVSKTERPTPACTTEQWLTTLQAPHKHEDQIQVTHTEVPVRRLETECRTAPLTYVEMDTSDGEDDPSTQPPGVKHARTEPRQDTTRTHSTQHSRRKSKKRKPLIQQPPRQPTKKPRNALSHQAHNPPANKKQRAAQQASPAPEYETLMPPGADPEGDSAHNKQTAKHKKRLRQRCTRANPAAHRDGNTDGVEAAGGRPGHIDKGQTRHKQSTLTAWMTRVNTHAVPTMTDIQLPAAAHQTAPHPPGDNAHEQHQHGCEHTAGQEDQEACAPQPRGGRASQPARTLSIAALNVRGLCTAMADVIELARKHAPDVLVLTETKLSMSSKRAAYDGLKELGYRQQHSVISKVAPAQAGVSILVHSTLRDAGVVTRNMISADLEGLVTAVNIHMPGSVPLQIAGVYMPIGQPGVRLLRGRIYRCLTARVHETRTAEHTSNLVIAGDFNAASQEGDRLTDSKQPSKFDKILRTWIKDNHMHSLPEKDGCTHRAGTFRPMGGIAQPHSRIDDVLVANEAIARESLLEIIDTTGMQTDHNMVLAKIPYRALHMVPPPQCDAQHAGEDNTPMRNKEPELRLKLPLSAHHKEQIAHAIDQQVGQPAHALAHELEAVIRQQVQPYWANRQRDHQQGIHPPMQLCASGTQAGAGDLEDTKRNTRQQVEAWALRLVDICQTARSTALTMGPSHTSTPGGRHHLPRGISRRRAKLVGYRRRLAEALRSGGGLGRDCKAELYARLQQQPAQHDRQAKGDHTQLRATYKQIGREISAIDQEHTSRRKQERINKLQALMDTRLKVGAKLVTGQCKGKNTMTLRAVETSQGLETDPDRVQKVVQDFYSKKMQPATGIKHGKYLPQEVPRDYPWMSESGQDAFTLCTAGIEQRTAGATLQDRIADAAAFRACVKTLASSKAPGPDGITNEILQMLPDPALQAIHALLQIMWATAYTPQDWKESLTVLLYKHKGTPMQLQHYRRIGLENTMYKLWTRLITVCMADYAEHSNTLSNTQAGFRGRRSTADQLEMMTMLLEDAQVTRHDIFLTMVDYSEAFDTIDHDKLLMILYDLGYPTDAIDVVKDLYTGATTRFKLPHGTTDAVVVDRGTIQGDSLSPFLFINYLEPMLRWLRVGKRGYHPGLVQNAANRRDTQVTDITFADDLNLLTDKASNMKIQVRKMERFSMWAHLKPNPTKTLMTGMLYKTNKSDPANQHKLQAALVGVSIGSQTPTVHPPTEPFRYLGVLFTMNLSWGPQYNQALQTLKDTLRPLQHACITTGQKLRVINACIRTKLKYGFYVAPYTKSQLQVFDAVLARAYKHAYWLRPYVSTAMAMEDINKGGLGCTSTTVDYTMTQVDRLTKAINDGGMLGSLTRASVTATRRWIDKCTAAQHPTMLRYSLRLRQMVQAAEANIEWWKEGEPALRMDEHNRANEEMNRLQNLARRDNQSTSPAMMRDICLLQQLGVSRLADLLSDHGHHVLSARQLALKYGTTPTQAQRRAIARISKWMTQAPDTRSSAQDYTRSSTTRQTTSQQVHYQVREHIRALGLCPTVEVYDTPIAALWEAQRSSTTQEHVEAIQTVTAELLRPLAQRKGANIRQEWEALDQIRPGQALQYGEETGYAVYTRLLEEIGYDPSAAQFGPIECGNRRVTKASLYQLYHNYAREQEAPIQIVGLAQATQQASKGTKTRKLNKHTQHQVVVKWKDNIMQQWMVHLNRELMGHPPVGITLATIEDVESNNHLVPECCGPNSHLHKHAEYQEEETIICDTCWRCYHLGCLPRESDRQEAAAAIEEGQGWSCQECKSNGWTTNTIPEGVKHVKVRWAETLEPRNTFTDDDMRMLAADTQKHVPVYTHTRGQPAAAVVEPLGEAEARHAMRGQGDAYPEHDTRYNLTVGQDCRKTLIIHTEAADPHLDIQATGRYEVMLRAVDRRLGGSTTFEEVLSIHTPDGRCKHTLKTPAAAALLQRFNRAASSRPHLAKKLAAGTFAQEVHHLIERYAGGFKMPGKRGQRVTADHAGALPEALMETLQRHTQAHQERFANPLDVHACTDRYWAAHPKDQLFGALYNSHGYEHTGISISHPPAVDKDINISVAAAIKDAQQATNRPVLTVMVLPIWGKKDGSQAYNRWIGAHQQLCKHVLTIPKKYARLHTSTRQTSEARNRPKHGLKIIAVGNQQGMQEAKLGAKSDIQDLRNKLMAAINQSLPEDRRMQHTDELTAQAAHMEAMGGAAEDVTRRLMHALLKKALPRRQRLGVDEHRVEAPDQVGRDPKEYLCDNIGAAKPLKYDWRQLTYTDGSVRPIISETGEHMGVGIGAGVYDARTEGQTCISLEGGSINEAELAAIHTAVTQGATRIATDSLTSIYQIYKQLHRPQDHTFHMHKKLLQEIANKVATSREPVELIKVKSHIGIVGNEIADELAGCAALKGPTPEDDTMQGEGPVVHRYDHPGSHRSELYWPRAKMTASPQEEGGGQQTYRPLSNLTTHTRKAAHQACRMGSAKQDTVYFSSWRGTEEDRDDSSYHMMHTGKITQAERATALKYRTGSMPSAKLMHRFNLAPNSKCALCGQLDGGHHTASGCQRLTKTYAHRHNKAGQLIMQAVIEGERGAEVVMMDLGREQPPQEAEPNQTRRPQDAPSPLPHRIPREALPATLPEETKTRLMTASIPDALLYKPATAGQPAQYTILEIKYCRDTDPIGQMQRAQRQHAQLEMELLGAGAAVDYKVLLLGVAGTIYKSATLNPLISLGVHRGALETLKHKLHRHAVGQLHWIYTVKRRKESSLQDTMKGRKAVGVKRTRNDDRSRPWKKRRK
jgi:exonuclease III/ribonuclease HI